jgi:multiple sugar transport system permease protein
MNGKASRIVRTTILVIFGLLWLIPVYLLLINASKDPTVYDSRQSWIPDGFALFSNIAEALSLSGMADSVLSTVLYSLVSPALAVIIGAAAGFGIVALGLKHGFAWFVVIFGGTIFPLQMILLPLFDGYSRIGLYDNLIGMILPFILTRLKLDPAVASGPLITSIADAVGLIVYFTIATAILGI